MNQRALTISQLKLKRPVKAWPWDELLIQNAKRKRVTRFISNDPEFTILEKTSRDIFGKIMNNITVDPYLGSLERWFLDSCERHYVTTIPKGEKKTLNMNHFFERDTTVISFFVERDAHMVLDVSSVRKNSPGMKSHIWLFHQQENSKVTFRLNSEFTNSQHLFIVSYLEARANFSFVSHLMFRKYQYGTVAVHHLDKESAASLKIALEAYKTSRSYYRLVQNHLGKNSSGTMKVKAIGSDDAIVHIDGLIKIGKNAEGTDSHLNESALLLSSDAMIKAIPNLEILNNDVACSHSATVGNIDPDQVYYLVSRGISADDARRLIVK